MSQPSTITLDVDNANDSNTTELVLEHNRTQGLKSTYHMVGFHSDLQRHLMSFQTTDPKRSGDFLGVRRGQITFVDDVPTLDANGDEGLSPISMSIPVTVPIGATNVRALLLARLMTAVALVQQAEDSVMDLFIEGKI
jgi:hypothetical protein